MVSMENVRRETAVFLERHWDRTKLGENDTPGWSANPYIFQGEIPNGTCRGCYAILERQEVVYIGLGAKRGSGRYEGHGINARLKKSYLRRDRKHKSTSENRSRRPVKKWARMTAIYTIGFPDEYSYLAHSLEAYLLLHLSPKRNKNLTGSSSRKKP